MFMYTLAGLASLAITAIIIEIDSRRTVAEDVKHNKRIIQYIKKHNIQIPDDIKESVKR